jgi:P2 family phage contractile tail tube protein
MLDEIIRDYVLFNGADRMVGRVSKFKPPALEIANEQFRGAGMDAPLPIDMGMNALVTSFTAIGVSKGMFASFGIISGIAGPKISVRAAALNPLTGISLPVIWTMQGVCTKLETSDLEPGKPAETTLEMQLYYYAFIHSGMPVHTIDVANGIRMINGVDQLLQMRGLVGR